jgi:uncharacterized protein DUF4160
MIGHADDQPLLWDRHRHVLPGFPHFHARHAEGEAKVRIDNLEVMDSNLNRRQLRFVLAWG